MKGVAAINNPPRRHFHRQRLLNRLNLQLKAPNLWICGPPGAGKTCLVRDYLRFFHIPNLWYTLDCRDRTATGFYHGLLDALDSIPSLGPKPPLPTQPQSAQEADASALNFFEQLFMRLPPGYHLVLDDFERIEESDVVVRILQLAVESTPSDHRLFIIGRCEPPNGFSRAICRNILELLPARSLQLDHEELQTLIKSMGLAPATQLNAQLTNFRGWITGLNIYLSQAAGCHTMPSALEDYFQSQVFDRFTAEEKQFLATCALLPRISTDGIGAMMPHMPSWRQRRVLQICLRQHAFIETYGNHLCFVPAYQAFLRDRCKQMYSQQMYHRLLNQAAEQCLQLKQWERAARILAEAGNQRRLADLLVSQTREKIHTGKQRSKRLQQWLQSLPETTIAREPGLLLWRGIGALSQAGAQTRTQSPQTAMDYLHRSYEGFKSAADHHGAATAWCTAVEYLLRGQQLRYLDAWLDRYQDLVDVPELAMRVQAAYFTALIYRRPEHPRIETLFQQLLAWLMTGQNAPPPWLLTQMMLYCIFWRADLSRAAVINQTMADRAADDCNDETIVARNLYRWASGNPAENLCDALLASIKNDHIDNDGDRIRLLLKAAMAALWALGHNNADHQAWLRVWHHHMNPGQSLEAALGYLLYTWHALLNHDTEQAHVYSQLSLQTAQDSGCPILQGMAENAYGMVCCLKHQYEIAYRHILRARRTGRGIQSHLLIYLSWISEAQLHVKTANHDRYLRAVKNTLSLGREKNIRNHPLWRDETMRQIYATAVEHQMETGYVRHVACDHHIAPCRSQSPAWLPVAPPVTIRMLGTLEISIRDIPQHVTLNKPLELLLWLLVRGGDNIPEEHAADALWPDADGDQALNSLTTTLSRLRRLMVVNEFVTLKNKMLSINRRVCRVDLFELLSLFAQWAQCLAADDVGLAGELQERFLSLHQGELLPGLERIYIINRRQWLNNRIRHHLSQLLEFWEKHHDHNRLLQLHRRMEHVSMKWQTAFGT